MAIVEGVLSDFGMTHLEGQHPTISFTPSGAALGELDVHAPDRVVAAPVTDGFFEVDLMPTDTIRPVRYYTVRIAWGSGRHVELPWKLFVPASGGRLAELLTAPANPSAAWIGAEPPLRAAEGTWWLYTGPDTETLTSGTLYEWSN